MNWKAIRADAPPAPVQPQEMEQEGWLVVAILPSGIGFLIYLRQGTS